MKQFIHHALVLGCSLSSACVTEPEIDAHTDRLATEVHVLSLVGDCVPRSAAAARETAHQLDARGREIGRPTTFVVITDPYHDFSISPAADVVTVTSWSRFMPQVRRSATFESDGLHVCER